MRNEDKIKKVLKTLSKVAIEEQKLGVTANDIGEILNLQRNVVSHYLNQMVKNGEVAKKKTKPVYFMDKEVLSDIEITSEKNKEDIFQKFIGYKGSLQKQVEKCKAATIYPDKGLPILLKGSSGVGKSYMARLIYDYAKQQKVIGEDAKFVVFNCAEYANNKELLSSKLFGHVKSAFTGADKDSDGIIKVADGGYLFLDEIHRLTPEGQEKLFLLLDKGMYQRVGENDVWKKASVRLICATTEDNALIDTFVRRIPITINLPDMHERELYEKLELIQLFYFLESKVINKIIKIDKRVVNLLLSADIVGNVGGLKNIIKFSCAKRYMKSKDDMYIKMEDLPESVLISAKINKVYYDRDYLEISKEYTPNDLAVKSKNQILNSYIDFVEEIYEITEKYKEKLILKEEYKKWITVKINALSEAIHFSDFYSEQCLNYDLMLMFVNKALKEIEEGYGIKFYNNNAKILATMLIFLKENKELLDEEVLATNLKIKEILCEKKIKYTRLADKLLNIILNDMDFTIDVNMEVYVLIMIISITNEIRVVKKNAIIIAHGQSTAGSIASVVNQLMNEYIFEAFDMPIDMSPKEIAGRIKEYLKKTKTSGGTLILVDMGSLFEIYSVIKEEVTGEVAVINNITTQLALIVGDMLLKNYSIKEIVDKCIEANKIEYKYFDSRIVEKAIIISCASGVGASQKIKDIIESCIGNEELKILAYDHFKLKKYGIENKIFKDYDVQLIISTLDLAIEGTEVILFDNLIREEGEKALRRVLKNINNFESIESIMNKLVRMLSLQNMISRMIILNPEKVINDTERIIMIMEREFNFKFSNNLKLAFTIHLAMMIERLVLNNDTIVIDDDQLVRKCNKNEVELLQKILDTELKVYSIKIPSDEIYLILGIIDNER